MPFNPINPASKLDAVNQILMASGDARVTTITDSPLLQVNDAVEIIEATTREVLSSPWHFNTDTEYSLSYDTDSGSDTYKMVLIPTRAITVDATYPYKDFVMRFDTDNDVFALYDKDKHTFEIEEDVKADIVWSYQFEQVPDLIRYYIFVRAARKYQAARIGSATLYEFTMRDEQEARNAARRADGSSADGNLLTGCVETNWIWQRTRNPIRYR